MPPSSGSVAHTDEIARGAIAVIVNDSGQLLMHLRDDIPGIVWPGYWSVLGGGCDPGEHPDQAIVRELHEEADLVLDQLTLAMEVSDSDGSGQLLTVYTGTWNGDPGHLPLSEGAELRFLTKAELTQVRIPPHIRQVLDSLHFGLV